MATAIISSLLSLYRRSVVVINTAQLCYNVKLATKICKTCSKLPKKTSATLLRYLKFHTLL